MRILACVLAGACTGSAPLTPMPERDELSAAPDADGAIVAELFTSQGCSSCPPADRLLTEIAAGANDRPVIALAFHVDYWNDLGWRDPFSSTAATQRQETYAHTLGRGPYTPQLVVNGRAHVVGSRRGEVERALASATPVVSMSAHAELDGDTLLIRAGAPAGTRAIVAVFENDLVTEVPAGENRGELLRNDHVVRALVPIGADGARVMLDPSWRRDRLGAVVLAQRDDATIAAARLVEL
jgi:hypothetical protein